MTDDPATPEEDFFKRSTVAIVGLGLMGGSLAMSLRPYCKSLLAVDPDEKVLAAACAQGVIQRGSPRPEEILPQADLVVLAAPVRAILALLERLPELHPGPALVLDLGSTKTEIVCAMARLPERFDPLGGHPMCGKEKLSFFQAEPGLFRGATFAFTRLARTTDAAAAAARQLCGLVGARAVWLTPEEHDRQVAATSHLPFLLSSALVQATPPEAAVMVGPGFRGMARLAATPNSMMLDVLATNRENILAALGRLRGELERVEQLLRGGDEEGMKAFLACAADQQVNLSRTPERS